MKQLAIAKNGKIFVVQEAGESSVLVYEAFPDVKQGKYMGLDELLLHFGEEGVSDMIARMTSGGAYDEPIE